MVDLILAWHPQYASYHVEVDWAVPHVSEALQGLDSVETEA